ncbi:MAG: hypothetical protein ACXVOH_08745, partial [Bacteroidia bacterium]
MRIFFLLLLALFWPAAFSQNNTDSLKQVLHSAKPDTLKAEAFVKVCMDYSSNEPATCVLYTDSALTFL